MGDPLLLVISSTDNDATGQTRKRISSYVVEH